MAMLCRRSKSQSGSHSGNTPLALAEGWSPPSMVSSRWHSQVECTSWSNWQSIFLVFSSWTDEFFIFFQVFKFWSACFWVKSWGSSFWSLGATFRAPNLPRLFWGRFFFKAFWRGWLAKSRTCTSAQEAGLFDAADDGGVGRDEDEECVHPSFYHHDLRLF